MQRHRVDDCSNADMERWMMTMEYFDMPITTNQIRSVLDFLHDGCDERIEKRPGNAARSARDRISVARANVRVQNGLSRSRDRLREAGPAGV